MQSLIDLDSQSVHYNKNSPPGLNLPNATPIKARKKMNINAKQFFSTKVAQKNND